ncbi:MAG: restriction endonuclease subunit S [Candidatus Cloacimonetes bacterium]|nr:restriction endonuclease subunit S [Candidatus Cloacimonadota bacterium]
MKAGWEKKPIGDICKTGSGGTPLKAKKEYYENGTVPWLLSGEVSQGEIWTATNYITQKGLENSSARIFPKDTVLVAMYGATAGQVGILRFEAATNQAVCGILPNKNFIPEFLYYVLMSKKDELVAQAAGNAQPNISQIKIKNTEIPLPPLPEQQRIVAILDEAFEGIAIAKANAEKNLQNARALFESHLQAVFSQRGDGWVEKRLQDVCEKITDGTHQTPTYFDEGVVFLSSRNVTSGKIDWDNIKYIDTKQHMEMHKRVAPRVDDILLAKNGTTGVAAIVDRDVVFDIYVSLALIRTLGEVSPKFLLYYVNSPAAKEQFNNRLKGVGVPNLHLQEIREVLVRFPLSKQKQSAVVAELDTLREETQRLASIYQQKLAALDALKKSLLDQAFRGEL